MNWNILSSRDLENTEPMGGSRSGGAGGGLPPMIRDPMMPDRPPMMNQEAPRPPMDRRPPPQMMPGQPPQMMQGPPPQMMQGPPPQMMQGRPPM